MKIEVTQNHISNGVQRNCDKCPIALALAEVTGKEWQVGADGCWAEDTSLYDLPKPAQDFIRAFDTFQPVQPFCFDLPIEPLTPS